MVGTGDPAAVNNSPMVSYRNADLELGKTGLRCNNENEDQVANIRKRHHI